MSEESEIIGKGSDVEVGFGKSTYNQDKLTNGHPYTVFFVRDV